MATIERLIMIDDLDGTESAEPGDINTVRFSVDGVEYEIDLTEQHDQELRELLAPFVAAARRGTAKAFGPSRRDRKPSADPEEDARRHYDSIAVPEHALKGWDKRTAYGVERTTKVAQWTLTERVSALTPRNVKLLGQYLGELPTSSGKPPQLGNTGARLRNLEMVDFEGNVTDFGRYAYEVRSAGVHRS
ncbi:Lsr2 family protein [Streptomyces sp. NPDC090112]|uniref:histone-like nucleoid-structuring protein Lsr2 n=1 Tax=Streptomyces sp. NPDC090112 TaxID=3365949 RepID=UPI0038025DE7